MTFRCKARSRPAAKSGPRHADKGRKHLLTEQQAAVTATDVTFRQSPLGAAILVVVMGLLTAGAVLVAIAGLWPAWVVAAFLGMLLVVFIPNATSAMRESSWVVALRGGVLFIKFRSYLNHHFDPCVPTVVALDGAEITAACIRREKIEQTMSEYTSEATLTFIDLRLAHQQTGALAAAIDEERRRLPPAKFITSKSKHDPVRVVHDGLIRVGWQTGNDRLRPSAGALLAELRRLHITVDEPVDVDRRASALSDDAMDKLVLDLAETGQVLDAVRLLRERYGYSLTEAKVFVDDLRGEVPLAERPPHRAA
jgi:hypothetical protein